MHQRDMQVARNIDMIFMRNQDTHKIGPEVNQLALQGEALLKADQFYLLVIKPMSNG